MSFARQDVSLSRSESTRMAPKPPTDPAYALSSGIHWSLVYLKYLLARPLRMVNVLKATSYSRPVGNARVTVEKTHPAVRRVRRLMRESKWKQAWSALAPMLKTEPNNASLHWVAGLLQRELGKLDQARTYLRFASQHIANEPSLLQSLGETELALGDTENASLTFHRALQLQPDARGLFHLADTYAKAGQLALEIQTLEEASKLDPQNAVLAYRLACAYKDSFDPTMSTEWAVRAVQLKPDYWDAYFVLGDALDRLERHSEALDVYQSLLLVRPNDSNIHINVGNMCMRVGLHKQAARFFERAGTIDPNNLDLDTNIIHQRLSFHDWSDMEATTSRFFERLRSHSASVAPFVLLSIPGMSPADLKAAGERRCQNFSAAILGDQSAFNRHIEPNEVDRRLRIGYLSSDLYEHATAYLMARLFELHDRTQFETYAYTWDKQVDSPLRQRLVNSFHAIRDIRGLGDHQAAELIRRDEVDILVDLKGHTRDGRVPILARHPAPVTVHHVGFPGTLGAHFVDYFVADRFVAPPEHSEMFTEELAYLPDCYQPTDDTRSIGPRPSRRECGLPEQGFVFCNFNQSYKYTPDVFDSWCRLLMEVPGSVLWVLSWNQVSTEGLRAAAESRGLDPSRLVFAPRLNQYAHLGRLQVADLVLDTQPVNSHTTASDALWAGVPIVTRPGECFVSRVAGSIVHTMGVPELIARDDQEYVMIAKELATHTELFQRVKERVVQGRTQSPLFDSTRYTKNLERLYREMWRRLACGLKPCMIDVSGPVK